jgi:ACS family sodium-dependent inorganic phosphate cotransporter
MMCGSIISIKTLRSSLASFVPIMAAEMGLSVVQSGALLTAFFPGYLLTQMPAGPLVQRYGGKRMLSVCLFGSAGCFLAAPLSMERGGVALISALFGLNGLLTGPMMPTLQQVNADWIPTEGQERPLVVRIQNLAHNVAPMLGAFLTPVLCRGGWKRAFYIYGGVVGVWGVLWHFLVSSRRPQSATTVGKDDNAKSAPVEEATTPEWRIFTLAPVLSLIFWNFSGNFLFAVLQILGPTYYTGTLHVSQERAGALLALAQLMNFPATMLGAATESMMLKRMPPVAVTKTLTIVASFGEAGCALLYGLSSTAAGATLAYGGVVLASMFQRAWSNYYEVGGKDVATLGSVANTVANSANLMTPYVAITLRRMFAGSWMPLLVLAAALKVASGCWFAKVMSMVDGRTLLAARKLATEEKQKV